MGWRAVAKEVGWATIARRFLAMSWRWKVINVASVVLRPFGLNAYLRQDVDDDGVAIPSSSRIVIHRSDWCT